MMIPMQNFHPKSAAAAGQAADLSDCETIQEQVIAALRTVYDPEIPLNIYDLGLIYSIDVDDELGTVSIEMTLTAPNCPVAGTMPDAVARAVRQGTVVIRLIVQRAVWKAAAEVRFFRGHVHCFARHAGLHRGRGGRLGFTHRRVLECRAECLAIQCSLELPARQRITNG